MNATKLKEAGSPSSRQLGRRPSRATLLLVASVALGATTFLTLDWLYTAVMRWTGKSATKPSPCRVADRVRHHALKPNCASIEHWGQDRYEFLTNSLGFRDERIREVPRTDARPRILVLGNSFTEGLLAWRDSYVGRVAAHFPQYDFLNGGVSSYSPSNYLNVARMVLAKGVDIDEAIVFIGIADVQDEAAFYRDVDASGAVTGPAWTSNPSWYLKGIISRNLVLTYYLLQFFEQHRFGKGASHVTVTKPVNVFDGVRSAWTYRKVNENDPWPAGYAPLGVEGGVAKEKAKMTLLREELEKRNIPISVVVYPYPAQVVHDTADSRQVRIWRDWCEGKCKRFISLFPVFLTARDQCPRSQPDCWYPSLFVIGDDHYNASGNALVADEVIKSLEEDSPGKSQPQASGPVR